MAPSNVSVCMASQLRQSIYYFLDNEYNENAQFIAERLWALDPRSAESAYLLSLCYRRLGDHRSAFEYSRQYGFRGSHLGCAYIFALSSLALERWQEGITALEKSRPLWFGKNHFARHNQSTRQPYPDAAAVYCLLGKLYRGFEYPNKAISAFEEALKLNPYIWDAFTNLCEMGVSVRVSNIFKVSPEMEAVLKTQPEQPALINPKETLSSSFAELSKSRSAPSEIDPFNNAPTKPTRIGLFGPMDLSQRSNESNISMMSVPAAGGGGIGPEAMETPTGPSASVDTNVVPIRREPGILTAFSVEPPPAPQRRMRQPNGTETDYDASRMRRVISSKRSIKDNSSQESVIEHVARATSIPPAGGERKRTNSGQVVQVRQGSEDPNGAPSRRSMRLFNQIRPTSSKSTFTSITTSTTVNVGTAIGRELKKARPQISRMTRPGSSASTVGRVVSGNRKALDDGMDVDTRDFRPHTGQTATSTSIPLKTFESDPARQEEALRTLLDLFRKLGSAHFALSQFQCQEALDLFESLGQAQTNTPWVLAQKGRAEYEQANYAKAEIYYRKIRTMAPTRFEDMEVYSTILWHLKRETDLAFLAHELIEACWQSPQAWCALGNSFSLSREHEQALNCFQRATKLDSKFAYAFTLQGHEHVANEEYDKAMAAYRKAVVADKRHYNAHYGLGRVYEKLGNYDKAMFHYDNATKINPTNAVLICCIGTVLEKKKDFRHALMYFSKATDLAPRSALTRFKKARALMALGEMQVALSELMVLKDLAPDEAMVHFLLGRLYKGLGEKGYAVRHFTIALNLDPKASQQIKEAIETLEHDDLDDEMSMMG